LKLLDPEIQMNALMVKLFICGPMPDQAPWKILIQHRIHSLRPKRGGTWPTNIHFILYTNEVHGKGSDLWWAVWRA
jgi:hypothetical protein